MTLIEGAVALVGLLSTGYFTTSLYRHRTEPTARPLLGVAVVMFVGVLAVASIVHLDSMATLATVLTGFDEGEWLVPAFVYPLIAMGLWVMFAFQYTGHDDRTPIFVVVLVGVLVLFITGPLFVDSLVGFEPALQIANFSTFIGVFVMAALSIVSLFIIVDESLRLRGYGLGEPAVFSGAVLGLVFTPLVVTVTREPASFPGLLAVSAVLFTFAVARFSTFETLPVARVVARDRLIGELDDPLVVVDREHCVRDLNPAAESHFDIERSAALGMGLENLLSVDLVPTEGSGGIEPTTVRTADGTELAVTVNRVTDKRNRLFGYLLVCRDVTDRRDRERRLGVLNQLLVGAVREQMATVAGQSARLATDEQPVDTTDSESVSTVAEDIWTTTTELASLVSRARDVERALATQPQSDTPTSVTEVLTDVLETTENESVTLPDDEVSVAFPEGLLRAILETLFADAIDAEHEVFVTVSDVVPEIHILVEESDLSAEIESQTASGLAIEIAALASEHAGGDLTVTDREDTAHIVLQLPGDRPETATPVDTQSVVEEDHGVRHP